MSEYIVDYCWLRSRIFGQIEHLTDDLTKIVRCRDCRYFDGKRWCDSNENFVEPDGFCKWGDERE